MEVREYVRERERMFNSLGRTAGFCDNVDCWECPFWDAIEHECGEDIETRICAVEKWSREHPKRTYLDVLLEAFPNTPLDEVSGSPRFCPTSIGFEDHIDGSECEYIDCLNCWKREYKENS